MNNNNLRSVSQTRLLSGGYPSEFTGNVQDMCSLHVLIHLLEENNLVIANLIGHLQNNHIYHMKLQAGSTGTSYSTNWVISSHVRELVTSMD